MSASLTLASLVLLAACAAGGASPSESPGSMPLPGGIEARARARVRADGSGPAVLEVTVTFYNPSRAPVEFAVLAHCPLLLRLRPTGGGQPRPAYDETERPCARSARVVRVPARGQTDLMRTLSLAELGGAGLAAGRYHAEVIVTVGPKPFEIDAGEADLELPHGA